MKFLVQGSASAPYVIQAEGQASNLIIRCSCPAGKKAAKFCKHVQSLLLGDVSHLVEPSSDVRELRRAAEGSIYLDRAGTHVPASERMKVSGCSSLEEVANRFREDLEGAGWVLGHVKEAGEYPSETLSLYERFKNGKPRKTPTVRLRWDEFTYDAVVTPDGGTSRENKRPRVKPWTVFGTKKSGSWGTLDGALHALLMNAGLISS